MAFRGSAGTSNSSASTSVVVTVSGIGGSGPQLNDIVLFFMVGGGAGGAAVLSPPAGFSAVTGISANTLQSTNSMCWYKVAGGSEPASYTATSGTSDFQTAEVRVYSGRSTTTPFTAVATQTFNNVSSPATETFGGLTAATGDDIVLLIGNGNNNTTGTPSLTNPSGYANQEIDYANVAFSPPILCCDKTNSASGATGTLSATETWTPLSTYGGYLISIAQGTGTGTAPFTPFTQTLFFVTETIIQS